MDLTNKRALFGIVLVIIGALFLLDNIGILYFPRHLFKWPIILLIIGVINIVAGNREAGFILLGVGSFFYLESFGIIDISTFWPLILIIVGLVFLFRGKSAIMQSGENNLDFFDVVSVFGGSNKRLVSQNLEGGKITSVFGGSEIDLRGAKPKEGAVIEVFAMFGGSEIIVPEDWGVSIDVVSILGGFADSRKNISSNPTVHVKIKGIVMLGGGDIRT